MNTIRRILIEGVLFFLFFFLIKGHVYTAIGDYPNALASHKQCVQLVKQMGDRLQEAREIGNVGAVYLAMGEFESAVDCHTQHLRLARRLGNQVRRWVFILFLCCVK